MPKSKLLQQTKCKMICPYMSLGKCLKLNRKLEYPPDDCPVLHKKE